MEIFQYLIKFSSFKNQHVLKPKMVKVDLIFEDET